MERIRRGFTLAQKSWQVLCADPELIGLAFVGTVLWVGVALGLFLAVFGRLPHGSDFRFPHYLWVFPILAVVSPIGTFTNAAIVGAATIRLEGGDPTAMDGIRLAAKRLPQLVAWSLFSSVVALFLQLLAERLKIAGRIVQWTIGLAWALATLFVVPVLLYEPEGVEGAIRRSAKLFKEQWGTEASGTGAIAAALLVVLIPVGIIGGIVIAATGGSVAVATVVIVAFFALISVGTSALIAVFQAALYRYAVAGEALGPYTTQDLHDAYGPRLGRGRRSHADKGPKPKLLARERWTMAITWVVGWVVLAVPVSMIESQLYAHPLHRPAGGVIALGVVLFLPAFVVPFLFAFGWRRAPIVSVVACAGGLIISAAHLYAEPWYGAASLVVFSVLAAVSIRSLRSVPTA
jgi:hypothetical protein